MTPDALVAVEMAKGESFTPPEGFALLDTRHYGKAQIVFLEADPAP
jgi:16S rRNA G966 N2-methylase RsmD